MLDRTNRLPIFEIQLVHVPFFHDPLPRYPTNLEMGGHDLAVLLVADPQMVAQVCEVLYHGLP